MAISDRLKKVRTKKEVEPVDFGALGAPVNRSHPFYFGFLATTGGLLALVVMRSLAAASQTFVLIIIALFLAMGLNPAVEALRNRGLSRTRAVSVIFALVIIFVGLFAWLVIPPVHKFIAGVIRHHKRCWNVDAVRHRGVNADGSEYVQWRHDDHRWDVDDRWHRDVG